MLKKFKRIANFLSRLFLRLAHVFEHLTCDDVPFVDPDADIEPTDSADLFSDDEEDIL